MFSTQLDNCTTFVHIFDIFLFAAELEEPKIGIWGKGLNLLVLDAETSYKQLIMPRTKPVVDGLL